MNAASSLARKTAAFAMSSGVDSRRIVLAGFSQGCAMTLMTGLRYPERLAGLVGMSGYLPLSATTVAEELAARGYATALFDEASARRIMARFKQTLEQSRAALGTSDTRSNHSGFTPMISP